jgi:hypothetical protein
MDRYQRIFKIILVTCYLYSKKKTFMAYYTQSINGIALVSLEGTFTPMNRPLRKKKGRYYTHVKLVQFTLENQKTSQIFLLKFFFVRI